MNFDVFFMPLVEAWRWSLPVSLFECNVLAFGRFVALADVCCFKSDIDPQAQSTLLK